MTAVQAPPDTTTLRNPSANEGRTVDYREEAKNLAAEDYQARIRRSAARRPRMRSRRGVRACSSVLPVFNVPISRVRTGPRHRVVMRSVGYCG